MNDIKRWTASTVYEVTSLTEAQRANFPHAIYRHETENPLDIISLRAAVVAVNRAGIAVELDVDSDPANGTDCIVVRTAAEDKKDQRVQGALFHGVTSAVSYILSDAHLPTSDVPEHVQSAATDMVGQVVGDPKIYEAFSKFYGGLRWSTDQEDFAGRLIACTALYDADYLDEHINGTEVSRLINDLDIDMPYGTYRGWYNMSAQEVFDDHPELDYHRLEDTDFRNSPEGQQLEQAYTSIIGDRTAQQYKAYPRPITDAGEIIPKPAVPLSRFPIIEALMVDEVSQVKPKQKYDFGAEDVVSLVLASDSVRSIDGLVGRIKRRLPEQERHVFDGPDEFQHKHMLINTLLHEFSNTKSDPERQAILRDHLLDIMHDYIAPDGVIAQSVRESHARDISRGYGLGREVSGVKAAVRSILTVGLASKDADLFIGRYLPDYQQTVELLGESDPLALSNIELRSVVLDALSKADGDSQPGAFERISRKLFQSSEVATKIAKIVKHRSEAHRLLDTPELRLVLKENRRFSYSPRDEDKSPEHIAAEDALAELKAPGESVYETATSELNNLLLEQLELIVSSGRLLDPNDSEADRLFEDMAERVNLGDMWHIQKLPEAYTKLVELVRQDGATDKQRADIIWKLAVATEYTDGDGRRPLLGAVLNAYELMLGPNDAIKMPTEFTRKGLDAANFIADHNGIFKVASEEDLQTLVKYKNGIRDLIDRTGNELASPDLIDLSSEPDTDDQKSEIMERLRGVANTMQRLEQQYEQFLHMEAVKTKPNVYYPWLLDQMNGFWGNMQGEVREGNLPTREIIGLYDMLADHVNNKLVYNTNALTNDFDVFSNGHLDTLLIECFERMVIPHDIKYNNAVYHSGLNFMNAAIINMPEPVVQMFRDRHYNNPRFLRYLEDERARWSTEEPAEGTTTVL